MLKDFMDKNDISVEELLDSIKVGIYVTDEKGNTLALNDECCKTGGLSKKEVIGKNMKELMGMGYVKESDSFRVAKSGKEERLIQHLGDGGVLYLTGVPIYKKGKMTLIVSTERDVTETMELEKLLDESKEKNEKYEASLQYMNKSALNKGVMIAESRLMRQVLVSAERLGNIDTTVLIQGESGTGKEMIADYIYQTGNRSSKPFIKVNCAAIPENLIESELFGYEKGAFTGASSEGKMGLFEASDGGTIFLDEIGDLPIQMQAKLLRVIQNKEVRRVGSNKTKAIDVKIIAATNIDIKEAVRKGLFREDLYYRLNVGSIEIPPLRSRREDIIPLTLYFIDLLNNKYGLNKTIQRDALSMLEEYSWPGNIRELRNVIERIIINYEGEHITKFQVYKHVNEGETDIDTETLKGGLKEIMERYEKEILLRYVEKYKTGKEIAYALKVDSATISRKLKKYGIII